MAKTAYLTLANRVDPRVRDSEGENNSALLKGQSWGGQGKSREMLVVGSMGIGKGMVSILRHRTGENMKAKSGAILVPLLGDGRLDRWETKDADDAAG